MSTVEKCRDLARKAGYMNARQAFELLTNNAWGPSEDVWAQYPIPIAPIGRIAFETELQILRFVLPLAVMAYGWGHWGGHTMLLSYPIAIVLMAAMGTRLKKAIDRKADAEWQLDRGRYRRTKAMSEALGLPMQDITLDLVKSIGRGFSHVEEFVYQANKDAAECAARSRRSSSTTYSYIGLGAAYAGHHDDDGYGGGTPYGQGTTYNPASGLPMAGDGTGGVDVGGNAYGTNDF